MQLLDQLQKIGTKPAVPTFAKTAPARSLGSTLEGARKKAPSTEERHKMRARKVFRQVEAFATLRKAGTKRLRKKPAPGKLPNVCPVDTSSART